VANIVEIMTACGGESSNTPEEAFSFIAVIDYVIPNNAPKSWIFMLSVCAERPKDNKMCNIKHNLLSNELATLQHKRIKILLP